MRSIGFRVALAALVTAALGAAPALAERGGNGKDHGGAGFEEGGPGKNHGKPHDQGHGANHGGAQDGAGTGSVTVTTGQRAVIQNYFVANPVGTSALPPGIAKNLARGKPLPPGIARKQAPEPLRAQLPFCGAGRDCLVAGPDLLVVDVTLGVISEIIRNVVR